MLVAKRYGDQLQDIRGFLRPDELFYQENATNKSALEQALNSRTDLDQHDVWLCWDWVCRQVAYPPYRDLILADWHKEGAFLQHRLFYTRQIKKRAAYDFWQYPFETLEFPQMGDCEDTSFLLASMLLNILPPGEVWVCVGLWGIGFGHAWVSLLNGGTRYVLETTIDEAPPFQANPYRVLEEYPYTPMLWINPQEVVESSNISSFTMAPRMPQAKLTEISEAYAEFKTGTMIEEIQEAYRLIPA